MMREKMKKVMVFLLVMAVMATSITIVPVTANAASAKKPAFESSKQTIFYGNPKKTNYVNTLKFKNVSAKAKISNVKLSNKKVLAYSSMAANNGGIYVETLKTGTCTVSCKVKQNGKSYTIKTKVTVKKADPFKAIKVDGKNIYSSGDSRMYNFYTTKKSVKVKFSLNKGWKVKKLYTNDHDLTKGTMSKNKTFKNGNKVTIKKSYTSVKLDVKNSKGEVYRYLICLRKENTKGNLKGALPADCTDEGVIVTELGRVE